MASVDTPIPDWSEAHAGERLAQAARPGNQAWLVGRRRAWLERALLVLSGATYAAAFPPLDRGWLGWFALIPLFWLVFAWRTSPGAAWRAGWLWGYAWAVCAFFWLREIEPFVPFLMAAVLALFPAFWAAAIPLLRRGWLIPLRPQLAGMAAVSAYRPHPARETTMIALLTAWWVVLDWVRSWLGTGLPWNFPAATQWRNLPVMQVAEFTGAYGITFLLVFMNLALALTLRDGWQSWSAGRYRRPLSLLVGIVLLMGTVAVGGRALMRGRHHQGDAYFPAGVVQADIPQCRSASAGETAHALAEHLRLTHELLARHRTAEEKILNDIILAGGRGEVQVPPEKLARMGPPGIVIWPETAVPIPYIPGYFNEHQPLWRAYSQAMFELIAKTGIRQLVGTLQYDAADGPHDARIYNSAVLLELDATILDRYDKIQIVPFGEFVPCGRYAAPLKRIFGMGRDLSRGRRFNPLILREDVRAGVNICYEDVFPYVSRRLVQNGANLLVVLTNDAWYPRSAEPVQHLANAVLRTVENRRPMLRCGNNAASCLILSSGAIVESIHYRTDADGTLVPDPGRKGPGTAVFVAPVRNAPPLTFYTRHGDLFVLFCGIAALFGGLACLWSWRERRQALADAVAEPAPTSPAASPTILHSK